MLMHFVLGSCDLLRCIYITLSLVFCSSLNNIVIVFRIRDPVLSRSGLFVCLFTCSPITTSATHKNLVLLNILVHVVYYTRMEHSMGLTKNNEVSMLHFNTFYNGLRVSSAASADIFVISCRSYYI